MKKGDFILIDFVGRVFYTGDIFDLTLKDVAEKEGILDPKHDYKPSLVVIGAGMVIPGVERALGGMSIGEEKEFVVKPDEAFGPRSPKLIKIISMAHFLKQKINPVPGLFVTIDNRQAKIQSVSGGRIRVDFNHPLAGRELQYKLKIVKKITQSLEKVNLLLDYYHIKADVKMLEKTAKIKTEKSLDKPIQKMIEDTITKWVKGIKIKWDETAEKTSKTNEGRKPQ